MRWIGAVSFALVVTVLACGGNTSSASFPGDVEGTCAVANQGACVHLGDGVAEGACCTPGQSLCAGESPPATCCSGYIWLCDSAGSVWRKAGLGCACETADAGPAGGDSGAADVGTYPEHDAGVGGVACGALSCSPGQVCVVDRATSGMCYQPTDAGAGDADADAGICPPDTVQTGSCCAPVVTNYSCQDLPAACKGNLSCDCASADCPTPDSKCSASGSTLVCEHHA